MGEWFKIDTTPSRIVRPLLIVNKKTGKLFIDEMNKRDAPFEELESSGCLEYVSCEEQEFIKIALNKEQVSNLFCQKRESKMNLERLKRLKVKEDSEEYSEALKIYDEYVNKKMYSHCELHPSAHLGAAASAIPYPHHSQAPRNTYQISMSKQSLTKYPSNNISRFDNRSKSLEFPCRAILEPMTTKIYGLDKVGIGNLPIVAFMAIPYTEEDAFVFKSEAIDAGLFRMRKSISFKSTLATPIQQMIESFQRPKVNKQDEKLYLYIQSNGLPCIDAHLKSRNCVIGKVRKSTNDSEPANLSSYLGKDEEGVVVKIYVVGNTVNVKISIVRTPIIGDKFSPRNAQKGTIGMISKEADMPYSEITGISPDMITSTHQIPSRMTISYLLEIIGSKYGALAVKRIDGTAFNKKESREEMYKIFDKYKLDKFGYEPMRSGISGRKLNKVFMGPCCVQGLKHNPADKIQARNKGPYKAITRQPVKGKKKNGGLRFGEMERDTSISHGAAYFAEERLCLVSDAYEVIICKECGEYAVSRVDSSYICVFCQEHTNFGKRIIPYASKLLKHNLGAACFEFVLDTEFIEETKNKILKSHINPIDFDEIENIKSMDNDLNKIDKIYNDKYDDDMIPYEDDYL
jgi:DNA-directed RNA polymerase II subunit RPB2